MDIGGPSSIRRMKGFTPPPPNPFHMASLSTRDKCYNFRANGEKCLQFSSDFLRKTHPPPPIMDGAPDPLGHWVGAWGHPQWLRGIPWKKWANWQTHLKVTYRHKNHHSNPYSQNELP